MSISTSKQKKIPKLRFPEFDNVWESKKLSDVAIIQRGKFSPRPRNNPKYYGGDIPFVQTGDVVKSGGVIKQYTQTLNAEGLKVSKLFPKGTVLMTIAANIGYTGILDINMACPDSLVGLTPKENISNTFLNYYFTTQREYMDRIASQAAQKNINIDFLKPYPVTVTSFAEQQKIADFLGSIDDMLNNLRVQKQFLETYKTGMMQKLFSQQIRFKDENDNNFPDWEVKKLGDVFTAVKGSGISKDDLIVDGKNLCILYGELYTTYKEVISEIKSKTNSVDGTRSKVGDLLVPCSTTTTAIDLANVTALNQSNVLLGGDITILRSDNKMNNVYYAYYLTNFKKRELAKYGQGVTIIHVYFSHFKEMLIDIPSLSEQQKIAEFLISLDRIIEAKANEIIVAEQWKKNLMQKMFI